MKIRINAGYLKALFLLLGLLIGHPLPAQENGGGGLGSVSTCPAAPEIAATAIAFTLSPQSGLNGAETTAQIRNIVRQATVSAPYLPAQIGVAAVQALAKSVNAAILSGKSIPNSSTAADVKVATAQQSVTTTEGYKDVIVAITAGVLSGLPSGGKDIDSLIKVCAAISVEFVKDAGEQAGLAAAMKQEGTLKPSNDPPVDDAKSGVEVANAFVAAVTAAALQQGFNSQEVALAINSAGAAAVDMAAKLGGPVSGGVGASGQVSGQVASQVAQQVAQQVASAVASAISSSTAASTTTTATTQQTQNNNQNAPNPTAAGLPGQSQNPFNGPPPIPQPTPTPNPSPTPTPTPAPTPTPPSRF